jgi:hypothetical protein
MTARPVSLAEIQRAMAASVMQPLTSDDNMQARTADGRPMEQVAASFIAPNSQLSAFERLEIYNRQYWYRVLDSLAEDFSALRMILGSRAFHALSIAYLNAHPSRSFTLRNLGAKLVDWLTANPQYAGRRHALAVDVARVEWAFVEAFDNAQYPPLTVEQIATLDAASRLALQPHVRLLALHYAADDLALNLHQRERRNTSEAGVQQDEEELPKAHLPRLHRRPTWVAAHRVDNSVFYLHLRREEFLTLNAIRQGLSLVNALESGFVGSRISQARRPTFVQEWFSRWAELGWICAPPLESLYSESPHC